MWGGGVVAHVCAYLLETGKSKIRVLEDLVSGENSLSGS